MGIPDDEIQLSLDPYDDLPESLAEALEDYIILEPNSEVASEHAEALEFVIREWDDLEDDDLGSWALRRKGRPLFIGTDPRGVYVEADSISAKIVIPESLMTLIAEQVAEAPYEVREKARAAMQELVGEWGHLLVDDEKLLGHLILIHGESDELASRSGDELIIKHVECHQRTRTQ
jgi:hypothetical protein